MSRFTILSKALTKLDKYTAESMGDFCIFVLFYP